MKNEIFLSIIIPAYNASKNIKKLIESIRISSFLYEIIIVDDGSIDDTESVVKNLNTDTIRYFKTKNNGALKARLYGLEKARGLYITFIDSDDFLGKMWFEDFFCAFQQNYMCDVYTTGFRLYENNCEISICENNIGYGVYSPLKIKNEIICYTDYAHNFGIYPAFWNKFIKKNLIEKVYKTTMLPSITMGDDAFIVFPLLFESQSICIYKSNCDYYYVQNVSSMTHVIEDDYFEKIDLFISLFSQKCLNYEIDIDCIKKYKLMLYNHGVYQYLTKNTFCRRKKIRSLLKKEVVNNYQMIKLSNLKYLKFLQRNVLVFHLYFIMKKAKEFIK